MPRSSDNSLPVTDRATPNNAPTCSCNCRIFVAFSMEDAGASLWAPWWLLLITRISSSTGLFTLGALPLIREMRFDFCYVYIFGLGFSFVLLSICTAINREGRDINNTAFPTTSLMLHGIFAVLSVHIFTVFGFKLIFGAAVFNPMGYIPLFLYLFDILIMQSQMRLPFRCAFIGWFFAVLGNVTVAVSDPTKGYQGPPIRWFAIVYGVLLVPSIFVIAITRIPWCCCKETQSQIS